MTLLFAGVTYRDTDSMNATFKIAGPLSNGPHKVFQPKCSPCPSSFLAHGLAAVFSRQYLSRHQRSEVHYADRFGRTDAYHG